MTKCSEEKCNENAIKEIVIKAVSAFLKRKYKIWIYVCKQHYKLEKDAGSILEEVKTFHSKGDAS